MLRSLPNGDETAYNAISCKNHMHNSFHFINSIHAQGCRSTLSSCKKEILEADVYIPYILSGLKQRISLLY